MNKFNSKHLKIFLFNIFKIYNIPCTHYLLILMMEIQQQVKHYSHIYNHIILDLVSGKNH